MHEAVEIPTDAPELRLFNPHDEEIRADPYPLYHRLRTEEPIRRSPFGVWMFTRYDEVHAILRDHRFSSNLLNAEHLPFGDADTRERLERRSKVMLFADPPLHTRLRSLVNKAFTTRVVEAMRGRVEQITDELLARAGDEIDLIADLAYPLPVTVIAEMLGVPASDHEVFAGWSRDLAANLDPFQTPELYDRAMAAGDAFDHYFSGLIVERRREPRDDLLTAMVHAEEKGDRLDEEELLALCTLLLVAGHETTVSLIGNGTLALLRQPDALARLREDPGLATSAIEELLRYDGTVQFTGRTALADVEVGGVTIAKGDVSIVVVGAANRDPARFPDPDRLDLARPDNKHLAFGGGAHFCLGAPLARLEGRVAIATLVRRFDLELAGEPAWRPTVTLRGLASLPLRLRPRAA